MNSGLIEPFDPAPFPSALLLITPGAVEDKRRCTHGAVPPIVMGETPTATGDPATVLSELA